jgi:hypothetical protein
MSHGLAGRNLKRQCHVLGGEVLIDALVAAFRPRPEALTPPNDHDHRASGHRMPALISGVAPLLLGTSAMIGFWRLLW